MGAHLTALSVALLDMSGASRTSFTNNEQLILRQAVTNSVSSGNRIVFTFKILGPAGNQAFQHYGNAAPGSAGNAQTQIAGIPISQFYTQPGVYTYIALASLDGETVQQQVSFSISSPNITLIYPPNGATDLTDSPVVLRWVGSGASKYRITVDITPSLFYALFTDTVLGTENSFSYPLNPSDSRQRLTAGQMYYWKVEGLDVNGNKIAESGAPFSFSIQGQSAALARDLAIGDLAITPPATAADSGPLPFSVTVANQGGTSETNVALKFSVGGLPAPESPQAVTLSPAQSKQVKFTGSLPADQTQALAIACIELFDDNVANNCKTLQLTRSAAAGSGVGTSYGWEEAWQIIQSALASGDIKQALENYQLVDMSGLSPDEFNQLLNDITKGIAKVNAPLPPESVGPAPPAAGSESAAETPSSPVSAPVDVPEGQDFVDEWADRTTYMTALPKHIVIRDAPSWRELWRNLGAAAPKLNFKKYMVVGLIAGTQGRADLIQIYETRVENYSMVVRYRIFSRKKGKLTSVPYHFRAIARSDVRVQFERAQ
ncbi:MAG: hypothetical protein HY551_01775 [Elusimicrobia bacterium]|nr:hypothetical protein [Elusimicrobiota bacterium]